MRVLGLLGALAAAAIVLVLLVLVGRSLSDASGSATPSVAKSGAQKAYEEMKGDGDLDDPRETMRDALRNP